MIYTTERHEAVVSMEHYLKEFVDVDYFLGCCRECPNYDKIWSCPTYDFDVLDYWKQYNVLELTAVKIIFDESYAGKKLSPEELEEIRSNSIAEVKAQLAEELYQREKEVPGSIGLSAGSCVLCKDGCTRAAGKPCRFPDQMRYSIESLGGNVGMTVEKIMGIQLQWMEEDRLPSYFVLVSGLLRP